MKNNRYAVISKLTLQVGVFVNNPKSVNPQNNIVVDLESHPQKDEVKIDWFYDKETNSFSETIEIVDVDSETVEEDLYVPSEQELIQAEILLNQAKIMAKLNQLEV